MVALSAEVAALLVRLGGTVPHGDLPVHTPIDGSQIGSVATATPAEIEIALNRAQSAFLTWRNVPAPQRGELVRQFGNALRDAQVAPCPPCHHRMRKADFRRRG